MMPRLFVSYKREDVVAARQLRQALRAERYDVWWDENLQGGQQWAQAIDEELLNAAIVVVLWSDQSTASDWVKHEASIAKSRGVLVPATISQCQIPAAFTSVQAVDLTAWDGSETHTQFRRLLDAIASLVAQQRRKRAGRIVALVAGLVISAAIGWALAISSVAMRTVQANPGVADVLNEQQKEMIAGLSSGAADLLLNTQNSRFYPRGIRTEIAPQVDELVRSGLAESAKQTKDGTEMEGFRLTSEAMRIREALFAATRAAAFPQASRHGSQ